MIVLVAGPHHGAGDVWRIMAELQDAHTYESPSTGFVNKIYSPSGSITALSSEHFSLRSPL